MVSLAVLEGLRDFDTALLANTLDRVGTTLAHEFYMSGDIQSVTPGLGPTVGVAVTCQIDTSTPGGELWPGDPPCWEPYWRQVDEIAAMDLPVVWVAQTVGSRPEHECVTGDGMAKTLYAAGCLGAVTNGRARDIAGTMSVPFAIYCRGKGIHHTPVRMKAVDIPVQMGGITINPGEIIHAGEEGVIKIPAESAEVLLAKAPLMRALEHEAHTTLRRTGVPSAEKTRHVMKLFERYGF